MAAADEEGLRTDDPEKTIDAVDVMSFLSTGQSYGLSGCDVERIETHCSEIFLVADRAYKLKRPIAFSVLDYRTRERREAACRAEVLLNRRTAPELYLGVHAIRRRQGEGLNFAGEGPALDWVVEMWRFDQADVFDRLADAALLSSELMRRLADEIARFHADAEPLPDIGGAAGLARAITQNGLDFATLGPVLDPGLVRTVQEKSIEALHRLGSLLDRRAAAGKVRRCHGDLRLANICLIDGLPTLFDGIEFSEVLSCIDVLYDLSFLLMDLGNRGLARLASVVLNRYLDGIAESDGLPALPLMLSIRSATRAFILACGAERRRDRPEEASHLAESAARYLSFAAHFLERAPARLVALGGLSSSAKSRLAYGLAAAMAPPPGARVAKAEVAQRRVLGLAAEARIPAATRTREVLDRTWDVLRQEALAAITAGLSAIVDAPLMSRAERRGLEEFAATAGVPFLGLWLGPPDVLDKSELTRWHSVGRNGDSAALLAHARAVVDAALGLAASKS